MGGALGQSLLVKLETAKASPARGDTYAANSMLLAFQGEVSAQAGKAIAADLAEVVIRLAEALKQ